MFSAILYNNIYVGVADWNRKYKRQRSGVPRWQIAPFRFNYFLHRLQENNPKMAQGTCIILILILSAVLVYLFFVCYICHLLYFFISLLVVILICFEQGGDDLLNEDGFPCLVNQWKGKKGLYCVGMGRRGFYGAKVEAQSVANDIVSLIP